MGSICLTVAENTGLRPEHSNALASPPSIVRLIFFDTYIFYLDEYRKLGCYDDSGIITKKKYEECFYEINNKYDQNF